MIFRGYVVKMTSRSIIVLATLFIVILALGTYASQENHSKAHLKLIKPSEQKTLKVKTKVENDVHPKGKVLLQALDQAQDEDDTPKQDQELVPYSFEDIFNSSLRPRGFDGTWLSGNLYSYRARDGNVYEFDAEKNSERLLMSGDILSDLDTATYFVAPDSRYILVAINRTQVWRHSWTAVYKIYNVSNPTGDLISFPNGNGFTGDEVLQYCRWSSSRHFLTFVYENNLYYQGSPHREPVQISESGQDKYVFNGIPDWVYEEDVIGSSVGHHTSPNNELITYVEYTSSDVPLQSWPYYGSPDDVYGDIVQITYPKAGDTRDGTLGNISSVRIYVYNTTENNSTMELEAPVDAIDPDGIGYYYTRIAWLSDTSVYVFWANRAQNRSIAMLYDLLGMEGFMNYEYGTPDGWIDAPAPAPVAVNDGSQYLTILPLEVAGTGTWPQIAILNAASDADPLFLTFGEDNVFSVLGVDKNSSLVYYWSTNGDSTERHIKRVNISDVNNPGDPECLTCDFPNKCRYVSATMNPSANYYIERCGGPGMPGYRLKSTDGLKDVDLENNSDVETLLAEKELPGRFFTDLDLKNGFTAKAEIFTPYGYNGQQSYPLLVYVYGGPNSQRVTKAYSMSSNTNNWLTYMKSTHKIVVASIDGRGTSGSGDSHRYQMYRNITDIGIEDQLFAARWMLDQDYVNNEENAAIFGWSYGGFMSSQILAESSSAEYQCGIAVAPVTTKRYYDSAYTERYLAFDLPEDNEEGYNNTDVLKKAAQFMDKTYLIAHGTADDNVHFMHMTQMVRALVEEDIQFRQLMYVDENHNIAKPNQARHLYRALTDFLLNDCYDTIDSTPEK